MKPTHLQPLPGGEQNSGRAMAVPLLGGVRGGFMVPTRGQKTVEQQQDAQVVGHKAQLGSVAGKWRTFSAYV